MVLIFKMVANIQINMDQWSYTKIIYKVYFNFPSRNNILLAYQLSYSIFIRMSKF